ncbi:MAG: CPBP family intramembrane glutamic endopeptidase [Pirellulaceae bacterium]
MDPEVPPEITPEMLQQHPELSIAIVLMFGMLVVYVLGGAGSWIYFWLRKQAGQPLIQIQPWTPRAWGLLDVLLIVVAVIISQIAFSVVGMMATGIERAELVGPDAEVPIALHMWGGFGSVAAMIIGTIWIMARFQRPPAHVGFVSMGLAKQLFTGLLVGLAVIPLTYILMIAVSAGMKTEYDHPLINEMTKHGSIGVYLVGFVTAAIIAPLTEEFAFRVVLQGWMQSIPFKPWGYSLIGGFAPATSQFSAVTADDEARQSLSRIDTAATDPESIEVAQVVEGASSATVETAWRPTAVIEDARVIEPEHQSVQVIPPIWPSIVCGILFGLAHWGYGLSFIPLIVLGIVLGLVYRATHSIWPCILIHFMLNASSMLMLGFTILLKQSAG